MARIRFPKLTYGIVLVALSSLAFAACGGGGSTNTDTSKAPTTASGTVTIGTGVHVTNTPTKKFRVKPVDTTESVALVLRDTRSTRSRVKPPGTSSARTTVCSSSR
jgi:hypothetical protein